MIEIKNVRKTYGKGKNAFVALKNINLTLEDNSSVAIVGKSGSGKSTLMHAISGLDKPQKGQVVVDGQNILKLKPKDLQYKSKKAIGDGMVGAVIGSKALLDNTGKKKYVVIKTGMSDATKDYKIAVKNLKDNNYKDVKFTVVKEDKKNKTKDLKFEVQSDNPSIKLSTHITPMGRSVTFFAQMSDKNAKEGKKEFDSQKVGKKMSTK